MTVDGNAHVAEVEPRLLLLHHLRENLGIGGVHAGCNTTSCGACTVHLDGQAVRSCVTPVSTATGKRVTTIESMARTRIGRAVQDAWVELSVAQCGYCQPGQVMAASALLSANPRPTDADIDAALTGNVCRCGAYPRIRAAVHLAARKLGA
jgi:isoquinoline 1-oxidoreductase subunit alpha